MRPTKLATVVVVLGLAGCVELQREATAPTLVIEPAELLVTVVDGTPVVETYTATLIDDTGAHDVTATTTFVLEDARYGSWSGSNLAISGDALGLTRVRAAHGGMRAQVPVIVSARFNRIENLAPGDAPHLFDRAVVDSSCAPVIDYPRAGVVMPKNLGELDIGVTDAHDDLFEVSLSTRFLDLRIYTRRDDATSAWTKLPPADWAYLAAQDETVTMRVGGVLEAAPSVMCKSAVQHMFITDQPLAGALYYMNDSGMNRFDAAHASIASGAVLSASEWEAMVSPITGSNSIDCVGCALSRDGTKLAIASPTTGAIYDFTASTMHEVFDDTSPHAWDSATFNATDTKLLTSVDGTLRVLGADGSVLATVDHENGFRAYDPQLSPNGRLIAHVVIDGNAATESTLVVRSFVDDANMVGAATEIMPIVPGTLIYYPSWSPDGAWLVFARASQSGSLHMQASLWLVRADGSQEPIQLTTPTANLDIRARFTPAIVSMSGERMFYITYESTQPFAGSARTQLWAMPFYPEVEVSADCFSPVTMPCAPTRRALAPAFRLPQPLDADNRLLQWTN